MNKNLLIFIILVLAIIGAGLGIYFLQSDKKELATDEEYPISTSQNEETVLEKNDFSILVPEGWLESNAFPNIPAMVIYADEEITDPAAQKVNFRSYYSINYDALENKTIEDYADYIKESLSQIFENIDFTKETTTELNGQNVNTIEMEITQKEIDFKVLTFLIKGKGNDVWIISFNTVKSNWDQYQELFQKIASSFKIK